MKCNCCIVHKVTAVLVLIGALNWGLVGAFQVNLVELLLSNWPAVVKAVYILVGLSALAMPLTMFCKKCKDGGCCCKTEK
ncbi:MAG: hypothetical protein ACD_51C00204G0003 [uncultured bacterium]|nr:MAG: hypothetical protein ACD_51C00204G0003 [uncultured bacterium]OGJ48105.1 MAG: hypothetical protein A2244_01290 [Candidatus Peregrinibacteria bacterium RIFOXYA2_FULL_41_18]OGJ49008.1 MAG: hypothetical protein A2344_00535 [Candidatus Peregrinibacteria bacterium RIFOXYB12_FULL_41_12]OGJ53231.1 MAG: hypothetical protein A2448_04870 [Candidatus Peregrinibacteria bacterium RIFOXYC2_FULL_41_22]OGJ54241.1 MAG: hypothetical protein A2336_02055 [Candidatus Peregrinibacteria bacterium RIFOXYB2_FULL